MSRWGELIPHDEDAAEEGRCLCGCQDDDGAGSDPSPTTVDTLYLDAEHFAMIAESQPPLEPRTAVAPAGQPFPGLFPHEETTP